MKYASLALTIALLLCAQSPCAEPPSRGLDALVDLLGKTADAGAQADILRGMSDALKGRRQVAMPRDWQTLYPALQKSADPQVRTLSVGLALLFGDAGALADLDHRAADAKIDPAERLRAVDALAAVHDPQLGAILLSLLDDPALSQTAIRDVAAYAEPSTATALLDCYPRVPESQRRDILSTLSSRALWAAALLDAVDAGKIPRADISALTIRTLSSLNDPAVNDRLKKSYGAVRAHGKDKAALIATYKKTFTPDLLAGANVPHGRLIFSKTCGVCHTLYDAGGKLGPNLTGSQRANLDYILEKVTDPSAVVPKENYTSIIETKDGRTITGILVSENEKLLTIRDATHDWPLAKTDIKSRKTSPTSMMPEGLLEAMSTSDARDLIAYLQSTSQVPLPKE